MRIVQLAPGAGSDFYCENCLRDKGRINTLRDLGHDPLVVPLYLPLPGDETSCESDLPIFFGGINVYLQQKSTLFRKTPRWIDRIFDSPALLKWASGRSGMTKAEDLGEMTISMLRGEEGNQAKELERLVAWLASKQPIDVIHISNAILLGMVKRVKQELGVPVVCSLQDEDIWLDALPEPQRSTAWELVSQCAAKVDSFISVSNYYKDFICERLKVPANRIYVVYNGIDLSGHKQSELSFEPPVIGFIERQCREKGIGALIDAFLILKKKGSIPDLKLRIAGGKTTDDEIYVKGMRQKLDTEGFSQDVEFLQNLNRKEKLEFFQSISILSVPAGHREAFGMYIIEALASGVPVVQPNHGAFTELLEATGGGLLCEPDNPQALTDAMETMLLNPERARELGRIGRKAVFEKFSKEIMSANVLKVMESVTAGIVSNAVTV